MPHQLEMVIAYEMAYIILTAGEKIVKADYIVALTYQSVAKVRADKAGTAGY